MDDEWLKEVEDEIIALEESAEENPTAHYARRDTVNGWAKRLAELSRRLNDLVRV